MTRRPPGRHRAPARVWPVATAAAVLTAASLGVLAAPRDVAVQQPAADPPGAVSDRVSRAERPAPLLTGVGATTEAVALTVAALPTRACRCAPRQPVVTVPTPTAQNTPPIATSAPLPRESPTAGVPTTPERETGVPSLTESSAPASTTSAATTTPPETSAPTSAPDTTSSETTTETALPETTAAETTAEVTEEEVP